MEQLRLVFYLKELISTIGYASVRLAHYFCIMLYVSWGNQLTAEKAFFLVASFESLYYVIAQGIPTGIGLIAEAKSASKRIKQVLTADEWQEPKDCEAAPRDDVKICIENVTAKIDKTIVLENISLNLKNGLYGLTGPTGKQIYTNALNTINSIIRTI